MKKATIASSHGTITIDFFTGEVLEIDVDPGSGLEKIYKFNLQEWHNYWQLPYMDRYDILDLGYWYLDDEKNSLYEQPAQDWREEVGVNRLDGTPRKACRILEITACKYCAHLIKSRNYCPHSAVRVPNADYVTLGCILSTKTRYLEENKKK